MDPHSVVTDSPGVGRCNVACRAPSAGRQKKGCITTSEKTSRKLCAAAAYGFSFVVNRLVLPVRTIIELITADQQLLVQVIVFRCSWALEFGA